MVNDENVGFMGGEWVVNSIFEVDNVEIIIVMFVVGDDINMIYVMIVGNYGDGISVEFDKVFDFVSFKVDFDGVVDFD